jgi:hypothetical protein
LIRRAATLAPTLIATALALVCVGLAGCGTGSSPAGSSGAGSSGVGAASGSASGSSGSASGSPGSRVNLASPVTGLLTKLDSEGLTKVIGFRMRLNDGEEVVFVIGTLENGAQFPPGHLAEHMATSSSVKVFFRDEGGSLVAYRLEDGPTQ